MPSGFAPGGASVLVFIHQTFVCFLSIPRSSPLDRLWSSIWSWPSSSSTRITFYLALRLDRESGIVSASFHMAQEKKLLGVCLWLAERFDVNLTGVRFVFILSCLLGFRVPILSISPVLLYFILYLLMPKQSRWVLWFQVCSVFSWTNSCRINWFNCIQFFFHFHLQIIFCFSRGNLLNWFKNKGLGIFWPLALYKLIWQSYSCNWSFAIHFLGCLNVPMFAVSNFKNKTSTKKWKQKTPQHRTICSWSNILMQLWITWHLV